MACMVDFRFHQTPIRSSIRRSFACQQHIEQLFSPGVFRCFNAENRRGSPNDKILGRFVPTSDVLATKVCCSLQLQHSPLRSRATLRLRFLWMLSNGLSRSCQSSDQLTPRKLPHWPHMTEISCEVPRWKAPGDTSDWRRSEVQRVRDLERHKWVSRCSDVFWRHRIADVEELFFSTQETNPRTHGERRTKPYPIRGIPSRNNIHFHN